MKLQQFKEEINKINFSKDTLKAINNILDKAIKKKEITSEEKSELSGLIKLEMDALGIYADSIKEFSQALENYDKELGALSDDAESKMKKIEDDFNSNINNVANNAQLEKTRNTISSI